MKFDDVFKLVTRARDHLAMGMPGTAAERLEEALDGLRTLMGMPTLGLPRGVDAGGEHYYAVQKGAVWEFDPRGWACLMERIADGRGYALREYGRCLTFDVHRLSKMSAEDARGQLNDLGV